MVLQGKIIPAIVTTTAVVAGLVCLELFKLALGLKDIAQYRNCFCNLAIPVFNMAEAVKPGSYSFRGRTFNTWDSVKVKEGDITLAQLIAHLKKSHEIDVYSVNLAVGKKVVPLFMDFGDYSQELATRVSQLVSRHVTLAPLQRCIRLEVTPKSEDDDDDDENWMDVGPEKEGGGNADRFPPVWVYFK